MKLNSAEFISGFVLLLYAECCYSLSGNPGRKVCNIRSKLSESLQQRVELVMGFFLALGKPVDAPTAEASQQVVPLEEQTTRAMDAGSDTASIFEMGRR